MIRQTQANGDPRRTIMLNGCSYVDELGYREELEAYERDGRTRSATSRRSHAPRIPAMTAGRAGPAGRRRTSSRSHTSTTSTRTNLAYICGNPEMILNAEAMLLDRGFPEANVKTELYWPKGKVVPAPAG